MKRNLLVFLLCIPLLGAAFSSGETVTSTKLNNLDDANIKADAEIAPEKIDDHSASNSEMDETSDPYAGSSQTLAGDLKDELKQLRYQVRALIRAGSNSPGTEKWYFNPPNLLESPAVATSGDILYIDATGNTASLSPGDNGSVFTASSTSVKWTTPQLLKLRTDLIKLAFRVLNADNSAAYALSQTWIDEFRDTTGLSGSSTNFSYRGSANFDVTTVDNSTTAVIIMGMVSTQVLDVPNSVLVEWGQTLGAGSTLVARVTRNGGDDYVTADLATTVTGTDYDLLYQEVDLSGTPEGTNLHLSFLLTSAAELEAAAISW